MTSLGARLMLWYSVISTVTLAGLVAVGFYLLNRHMVHSLDLLNLAEFENVKARLGPETASLSRDELNTRMQPSGEDRALVFYIEIREADGSVVFNSRNLSGQQLSVGGTRSSVFDIELPGIGELRAGRFPHQGRWVVVASPKAFIDQIMDGYAQVALVVVALGIVASVVAGLIFSQIALRPVRIIQETANRIRLDNLSQRIPVSDVHDEISDLARLLNEMFDRLETSFNQVRRFSAEASHELKTPLSLVRLQAEKLLLDEGLTSEQQEAVQVQMDEISRLEQIIEDLLFLSRAEAQAVKLTLQPADPCEFLTAFIPDARVLAEHRGIRFSERIEGKGVVPFDSKWIRQVLLNLIINALNVAPRGSLVTLDSEITLESWRIAIEDEGPGVPADQRERIFERFVRLPTIGAEEVKGSGLGLAIARGVVELHHGVIRAESGPRKGGLRVVVELPLPREKPPLPTAPTEERAAVAYSSVD
jgi:signal transduction histidine kinase